MSFRSLLRQIAFYKSNNAGSIIRLSINIACVLIIFQIFIHELSFDTHHQKSENNYHLTKEFPNNISVYNYLDKQIPNLYDQEKRTSFLIHIFKINTISISAICGYGLITFATNQIIQEIGIRRVNSTKVIKVLYMLNKEYFKTISLDFEIGTPFAYYIKNKNGYKILHMKLNLAGGFSALPGFLLLDLLF